MSTPDPRERRDFCKQAGAALALFAFSRGLGAAEAEAPAPVTTAETRAGLAPGQVKDYRKQGNFFLAADARGVYALSSLCTHAGCSVRAEGTSFGCPCHDSEFDLHGAVTQGPAKLPLRHYEVRESRPGGPLVVDPSKTVSADARL